MIYSKASSANNVICDLPCYRMEMHDHAEFEIRVPSLPAGVPICEGVPRSSWNTKCVTITNEAGIDVAKGICHSVDPTLVIDTDGSPLGDDRVAIQIAESLIEAEVPSVWMWSMRSWHISRVYLNGASLLHHNENAIYKAALNASRRRVRGGVRPYETTRERREPPVPPKRDFILSTEAINAVSSKVCCPLNCVQPFPRAKIQALRTQLYVTGSVYFRKHVLLEVHRQIHRDARGKDMITLEGIEVCPTAWSLIHSVSRATFHRYKGQAESGMRPEPHGNLGSKKPRLQTLQATATLRTLLQSTAD